MDTTPTLEMLTTPNSPQNKKAINKQLKFIERGLRATRCIVAGGAPRDHFDGVAAADLDFYVPRVGDAGNLAAALGIERLTMIWSLENRPASTSGAYADGTSEQYLQLIFEGVASHLGDTVKVNIMALQPHIEVNTRSDLIVQVLKHFPEGTSHHVYTIHEGNVILMRHDPCVFLRSAMSPPEYREKVLRKLMLRNSPLLEQQLRANNTPWSTSEYYYLNSNSKPMIMRLNRGQWDCRKITKSYGVGQRTSCTQYERIRGMLPNIADFNYEVFNQYDEGEITLEQYRQHLAVEAERRSNLPPTTSTITTNDLSALRSAFVSGGSSVGSLSRDWTDPWVSASAVQPSRGPDAELVEAQRQERERVIRQIINSTGAVRVTGANSGVASYRGVDISITDF